MRYLAGRRGAAVVLDPRSGAVLALASQPSFDPVHLAAKWENVRQDSAAPLLNRATQGLYPPGSTLKLVTLAAALTRRTDLVNKVYHCSGKLALPGYTIHCSQPHGELDLASALSVSCNVTFAQLGIELGNGSLAKQAERARFNRNIPFELPLGVSSFPPGKAGEGETAQRAIGQGQVLATDVYKRQILYRLDRSSAFWQVVWVLAGLIILLLLQVVPNIRGWRSYWGVLLLLGLGCLAVTLVYGTEVHGAKTVSYTHLDVYKRQQSHQKPYPFFIQQLRCLLWAASIINDARSVPSEAFRGSVPDWNTFTSLFPDCKSTAYQAIFHP